MRNNWTIIVVLILLNQFAWIAIVGKSFILKSELIENIKNQKVIEIEKERFACFDEKHLPFKETKGMKK